MLPFRPSTFLGCRAVNGSIDAGAAPGPLGFAPEPGRRGRPATNTPPQTLLVIAAGGLLTAALVLRFWARSPLWLDEAQSVGIAGKPLTGIPGAFRQDGAPPLYYFLLHIWMAVFGHGRAAGAGCCGGFSGAGLCPGW